MKTRTRAINSARFLRAHLAGEEKFSRPELAVLSQIVREECKQSLYFFARYVLGFDKLTPETHEKWALDLQAAVKNHRKVMRLKPRGTYKTTLYGVAFLLWLWACVSSELRFLYTSASEELISEVADSLDKFVGRPGQRADSLYALLFGVARQKGVKNDNLTYNITGRGTGKGFSLVMKTVGSGTTGLHPNIIIVDDPSDQKDRESAAVRKAKKSWLDTLPALIVPFEAEGVRWEHTCLIGTRWHLDDVVAYAKQQEGWDVESESVYADDGKSPRYPEFFPADEIAKKRQDIKDDVFWSCQYLNNPLPAGLRQFDPARITRFDVREIDLRQGENYCFIDPSKGKKKSDFPATIWVHRRDGFLYIFDAFDQKMELDILLTRIAEKNKLYGVREMFFEDFGVSLIEETLIRQHEEIHYPTKITPIRSRGSKEEVRIPSLQPHLTGGVLRLRSDAETVYPELWNQLIFWPVWGHDDFPDVLEMACSHLRAPAHVPVAIGW